MIRVLSTLLLLVLALLLLLLLGDLVEFYSSGYNDYPIGAEMAGFCYRTENHYLGCSLVLSSVCLAGVFMSLFVREPLQVLLGRVLLLGLIVARVGLTWWGLG